MPFRGLKLLGITLAILNVSLWFAVPTLRWFADALLGRPPAFGNPTITFGVQELLVYLDPWLVFHIFPFVFTFGIAAIPFLFIPRDTNGTPSTTGSLAIAVLLLGLEANWVALIAIAVVCRGPDWNFYWPWEEWDGRIVMINNVNLCDLFWFHFMRKPLGGMFWIEREAPGLLFAIGYVVLGFLVANVLHRGKGHGVAFVAFYLLLVGTMAFMRPFEILAAWTLPLSALIATMAYLLLRLSGLWSATKNTERPMAYWRCVVIVLLFQIAMLIPTKIALRWAANVKYVIFLPEYSINV